MHLGANIKCVLFCFVFFAAAEAALEQVLQLHLYVKPGSSCCWKIQHIHVSAGTAEPECILEPDGAYLAIDWTLIHSQGEGHGPAGPSNEPQVPAARWQRQVVLDSVNGFINSLAMDVRGQERPRLQCLLNVSGRWESNPPFTSIIIMMTVFLLAFVSFNHVWTELQGERWPYSLPLLFLYVSLLRHTPEEGIVWRHTFDLKTPLSAIPFHMESKLSTQNCICSIRGEEYIKV